MSKVESAEALFEQIFSDISRMSETDRGPTLRRVLQRLIDIASKGDIGVALLDQAQEADDNQSPNRSLLRALRCPGDGPDRAWANLSFEDNLIESNAVDRRRTLFIDPAENIAAGLIDLIDGRVENLEFQFPDESDIDTLMLSAWEKVNAARPPVTILLRGNSTHEEIIAALRSMTAFYEQDEKKNLDLFNTTARGRCSRSITTTGGGYVDNGRSYMSNLVEIETCENRDRCCGNVTYTKRETRRWSEITWRDGSTSTPPPAPPPDYVRRPWENRLPLFDNPSIGTQTSDWGWRNLDGESKFHSGIDIAAAVGARVTNAVSGEIVWISRDGNPERAGVIVRVGDQTHTYWHINPAASLRVGQTVNRGTGLGTLADWGSRTHLHYATHNPPGGDWTRRAPENSVDPLP
jgi:Peptidase family M23